MNWDQLISNRRFGAPEPKRTGALGGGMEMRTEFDRDYDRLIFSAPFRRLQNKAQIFPLPKNIFVHNRLTHSLEVSCVGRSLGNYIARRLTDNQDTPHRGSIATVVSAACLAHDMGNPPFGHSGERAIRAYFTEGNGRQWYDAVVGEGHPWEDFAYFEGNANGFRLLTHQFEGRRPGGFALTYTTLAAIVKYPWSSARAPESGKFGYFQSERETYLDVANYLGILPVDPATGHYVRHPLVYLVEAADDICYQVMDVEDAYKLRILSYERTVDLLLRYFLAESHDHALETLETIGDRNERIAYLRAKAINILVEACAEVFIEHEEEILRGAFTGTLVSQMPKRLYAAYRDNSEVAQSEIYTARAVIDVELAGHRIFSELIDKLMHSLLHPDDAYSRTLLSLVSSQYNLHEASIYGKLQCTLDYISGMTDPYALDLYRRITGMNLPAI
ncbi:dGTP triphosphohydrolase [uncultured Porphyromonas sp.]|uniref:dGTP triphosphohydrolase n=1 Tax=uncultured Porphyromonas sp. TaxID=159274 RepID=UPI00261FF9C4|nr:dNTP triphosphohydrolase [uncultured Porphyromonas sp.]